MSCWTQSRVSCVPTHRFASIRRLPITIQRPLFLTQAIEHCKLCPSRVRFVFSAPFCFPLPLFFSLEWRPLAFGVLACTTHSWDKSSSGRSTPPIQLSGLTTDLPTTLVVCFTEVLGQAPATTSHAAAHMGLVQAVSLPPTAYYHDIAIIAHRSATLSYTVLHFPNAAHPSNFPPDAMDK